MDLDPVIARLRDQITGRKSVGGAADLDAAMKGKVVTPAFFVMLTGEAAGGNPLAGGFSQTVANRFAVVTAIANQRDAAGGAASSDLAAYRRQVKQALCGWVIDVETGEQIEFLRGDLVAFADGLLWWADEFTFNTYERTP